jgi:hypothetical protein
MYIDEGGWRPHLYRLSNINMETCQEFTRDRIKHSATTELNERGNRGNQKTIHSTHIGEPSFGST